METKKRNTRKMDMLTAVEKIVGMAKDSNLDAEFYRKAAGPVKFLSEKMELTREQAVMMAMFIDNSSDTSIRISDFSRQLECSTTRIIRYMNDIDELEKRELVICSRERGRVSYRVPWEVIEAFKRNEKYVPRSCSGLSCEALFGVIEEIMEMRDDNEMTTEMTVQRLEHLLECNRHLVFVQKLKSMNLMSDDEMLLLVFSHLFVNNGDDDIRYHDLSFFYESKSQWNRVKRELNDGINILQELKLIEYNNDNGFADRESFRMTRKAKEMLFPELNISSTHLESFRKSLIRHEEIVRKQLHYDREVAAQVSDLERLLEEAHYREICNRLKDKGHRTGFTCLFYGAPGTGKTESVLQLARQTGRDIMQVNVQEIKSMWVGESEKNIKALFDRYRRCVEKSEVAPILLFNEADAIIGKRQEGAERAVEKMENSIQNIILQEMETLDGILIATTNLVQNMDKAFERRFLYKIRFNKPSLEARLRIWQSMLPDLPEADLRLLAGKYDFSGGQIENIARHYAIDSILHGDAAACMENIMEHCEGERIGSTKTGGIGFHVRNN